jgi:predicted flap endonuclease-1-like 5' DNA nuclease
VAAPVAKKASADAGLALAEPRAELHELVTSSEPVLKNVADPREKQGSSLVGGVGRFGRSDTSDRTNAATTPKEPAAKTPPKSEPKPADLFDLDEPLHGEPKSTIDWSSIRKETSQLAATIDRLMKPEAPAEAKSETKPESKLPAAATEQPKSPLVKSLLETNGKSGTAQPLASMVRSTTAAPAQAKPASPPTPAPAAGRKKFYLNLEDDIEAAPSIGPKQAARLAKQGIRSVQDFLKADPEELADKLGLNHISGQLLRDWQKQAKLNAAIPNLRGHDAQILVGCGLHDPKEIAAAKPEDLLEFAKEFAASSEGQRVLRNSSPPDLAEVKEWIEWAKEARAI